MLRLACFVIVLAGCGSSVSRPEADAGSADGGTATLVGVWQVAVGTTGIGVTFSGTGLAGPVETMQSVPVAADLPSCRTDLVATGTYVVTGSSITLDTPTAVQRTHGCTAADTESPIADTTPQQSFARALSGPFVLTDTTLTLGSSYPTLTRLTR